MCNSFCHIHNHTEYSLLDGANRIPDMVKRAKEMGMDSLAISDHGVMFGVMEFYMECQKAGVKPLLGVEAYMAPSGHKNRKGREENETFHQLLLAKDLEGYRNLCKLSSIAALEGYYYKPRIDHDLLRQYSKGLVGTSTCLGSEICQHLLKGEYDKAQYLAGMYSEIFGEGNYFIELQDHRLPEQAQIREPLIRIARELKLPLVATNDAHYLCRTDHQAHDVLLCIQTGSLVADTKRMKFGTEEFYLKSGDEMAALFPDVPEALENTQMIAEMCNVELGKQRAAMPLPDLPDGENSRDYLRKLCVEALPKRVRNADENAMQRLDYELSVIEQTGFEDYMLLVRGFANAARERGIFYGARGSAAGSLVSYCLGITDVDPVEYDLTFERFLNPERVSMPDIDMDFEDSRRDEIIKWVTEKYGTDHVAQIVTFGTLGAKAAIKDCGRVQGYTPQETDKLCKTIPTLPGWSIQRAYGEIKEFKEMVDGDPRYATLVEIAKSVEGMSRHCGVHAAGVVISRDPLVEYVPLYKGNDGQAITAYEMGILEKIGLLKMDFLGLSNLSVLAKTVKAIEETQGFTLDIQNIPLDDAKTYEMLARGETIGVFQLEGGGMTRYVQQLKPANVRELAAMVALYRPGPMEHIPRFIDTKFGRAEAQYLDEKMRPLLEETYGIIVYQDQVLKLVQALAGFTLGKADILRRAMGKKDAQAMADMKAEFIAGTSANEISVENAGKIWELLLPFAGYAFNKAHAICYSMLAYQTAYLKANYPIEYMTGLLAVYRSKEDRVTSCIEECRRMKIPVLAPDVNSSLADFKIETQSGTGFRPLSSDIEVVTVVPGKGISGQGQDAPDTQGRDAHVTLGSIRFGLAAIKGVGEGIVEAIIKERTENGPFIHLYEFCERIRPFGLNRTAVEALVRAGAFDTIEKNRRKLLEVVDGALSYADSMNRSRLAGQVSLFGGEETTPGVHQYPILPDQELFSRSELLAMEKEVMGIYVSDHPLRGHERTVQQAATHSCAAIIEQEEQTFVKIAGVIAGMRTIVTKAKGEKMATLTIEDFSGQAGAIAFPATYAKFKDTLVKDTVVTMTGWVMHRDRPGNAGDKTIEIRMEEITPLEAKLDLQYEKDESASGLVTLNLRRATEKQLFAIKEILARHPGSYELQIQIMPKNDHPPIFAPITVDPSEGFIAELKEKVAGASVEVHRYRQLATA